MLLLNLKHMGLWSGGCSCTLSTYKCIREEFDEESVGSGNPSFKVLLAELNENGLSNRLRTVYRWQIRSLLSVLQAAIFFCILRII